MHSPAAPAGRRMSVLSRSPSAGRPVAAVRAPPPSARRPPRRRARMERPRRPHPGSGPVAVVATHDHTGPLGVLGVEVHLGHVVTRWIATGVGHDHDLVVLAAVDDLVQTEHRRAEHAGRAALLPPSGSRPGGVGDRVGIVGGLEPGDPLLVGPRFGVVGRFPGIEGLDVTHADHGTAGFSRRRPCQAGVTPGSARLGVRRGRCGPRLRSPRGRRRRGPPPAVARPTRPDAGPRAVAARSPQRRGPRPAARP